MGQGLEIAQRSRTAGSRGISAVREQSKAKMKRLYQGLMRITRAVVRHAEAAVPRVRRATGMFPGITGPLARKPDAEILDLMVAAGGLEPPTRGL